MTADFKIDDTEHFVEGLVHLADMLELADPRRKQARESQRKLKQAGISVPIGDSYEEWRDFCLKVAARLRASYGRARTDSQRATLDAAIQRIEQMVE